MTVECMNISSIVIIITSSDILLDSYYYKPSPFTMVGM